ncbi:hypothetical protein Oweho_0568 [Owenweeksia hongkongensis DSM 17368]|uniref:Transmembrane protein n=1 Tax=Owenweeksia hongkongensis (strain DSM 17368 / CIP 108786 / JCM 12287 / NRRL B-23963 / UST20020801) TaxID=926562 RepID=G8R0C4_OWEHD|nr:hypothetical protein [Owenweeksia hongkongensis]AEV31584.1 hypothetical protein Oweho_0568 [Owenweeksia hongkongensis DSM 17368]
MQKELNWIWTELKTVEKQKLWIYTLLYLLWGWGMNLFGQYMEIARFTHWWQIITVYLLYMVPISVVLRNQSFHRQYAYGLIFMGLLEFGGYTFHTSYAYPNNLLDQFFSERNFSLAMALFFAFYFPLGNAAVNWIYQKLKKN